MMRKKVHWLEVVICTTIKNSSLFIYLNDPRMREKIYLRVFVPERQHVG